MSFIQKGGKRAQIGEERLFGGKPYVKTPNGWKPQKQSRLSSDDASSSAQSVQSGDETLSRKSPSINDRKKQFLSASPTHAKITSALSDPSLNQTQKVQKLFQLGITDRAHIVDLTGAAYSRVYQLSKQHQATQQNRNDSSPSPSSEDNSPNNAAKQLKQNPDQLGLTPPSVTERWDAYDTFADMFANGISKSLVAFGSGGLGKMEWKNARIYTPTGFTTHGQIQIGDIVLTPSGRHSKVLQVYPHLQEKLYRLTLKDGSSVLVGGEHLFKVWNKTGYWDGELKKRITGGRWQVLSVNEMIKLGVKLRDKSTSRNGTEIPTKWRFLIPYLPTPINFTNNNQLPIHPYLLGQLLGNGNFTGRSTTISMSKDDAIETIPLLQSLLPESYLFRCINQSATVSGNAAEYNIVIKETAPKDTVPFIQLLQQLGLGRDKFIPEIYKYCSVEDRLSLLRGLCDTDASCEGKQAVVVYYSMSDRLAEDVRQLALSFGKYASNTKIKQQFSGLALESRLNKGITDNISEINQVYFTMPDEYCPFQLTRKAQKWSKRIGRLDVQGKAIVSIEYELIDDAYCIAIDDPEHLYITDDFITTHNTYTWMQKAKQYGLQEYDEDQGSDINDGNYDYVKITGKVTAAAIFQALWEHNGKKLVFDDCDSALEDDDAVNLFKGALDTSGDGTISWGSQRPLKTTKFDPRNPDPDKDGKYRVPSRFKFTGQVMFISNLPIDKMPQPLVDSRAISIDLSMTPKQTVDRMRVIIDKMPITDANGTEIATSQQDRQEAVDFLDQYAEQIRPEKLNARTLGNIIKIQQSSKNTGRDWKRLALVMLAG